MRYATTWCAAFFRVWLMRLDRRSVWIFPLIKTLQYQGKKARGIILLIPPEVVQRKKGTSQILVLAVRSNFLKKKKRKCMTPYYHLQTQILSFFFRSLVPVDLSKQDEWKIVLHSGVMLLLIQRVFLRNFLIRWMAAWCCTIPNLISWPSALQKRAQMCAVAVPTVASQCSCLKKLMLC